MHTRDCLQPTSASPIDDVIDVSHADAANVLVSFVSGSYADQSNMVLRSNTFITGGQCTDSISLAVQ